MPIVRIDIIEGKSQEYKGILLNTVHQLMLKYIGIKKGDRRQILTEHKPDHFEHGGRSDSYTVVEISLIKGRTYETKKVFYRELVNTLSRELGIPPNDITIILNEQPGENWGIRGGFPASEVL